ncbi:cytochrome P450 [Ochromonadaceae sp. CCMP2298]|nr:cytochrome P450 [Ochromonadaceae sp. CCMP2298]
MDSSLSPSQTVAVAGLVALCGAYVFARKGEKKEGKESPLVPGWPILGNALDMDGDAFIPKMDEHAARYGTTFRLNVLGQKYIHLGDPVLVKEVLGKRPKLLKRATALEYMGDAMGYGPNGLFHARDPHVWQRVRKLMSPAFSKANLASNSPIYLQEALNLVKRMLEGGERQGEGQSQGQEAEAGAGAGVDMQRSALTYTTYVISRVALGTSVPYFFQSAFSTDVKAVFDALLAHLLFPGPLWLWRLSPSYKLETVARTAQARIDASSKQTIDNRKRVRAAASPAERRGMNSLIDVMLRRWGEEDEADTDTGAGAGAGGSKEVHEEVQEDEIIANIKTLYLAGSETTSNAISWAVFLLTQHPQWWEKLRLEAAPFFASAASKSHADLYASICELHVAHAVLKEALRLYPVGPIFFFDFVPSPGVPDPAGLTLSTGEQISRDTTIICNFRMALRDAAVFPQPEAFLPERWLPREAGAAGEVGSGSDPDALAAMEAAYVAFGAGPRVCPGIGLAMAEGAVALAAIAHHCDITLACAAEEVQALFRFTLQPSQLPVRVRKI